MLLLLNILSSIVEVNLRHSLAMRKVAIFIPSMIKNVAQPPSISSQAVADHVIKIITSNNNNDDNKTLHLLSLGRLRQAQLLY